MKLYLLAFVAAAALVACSETTDSTPVDPNPGGASGADTTTISQLGDTLKIDIRKDSSTFQRSYSVYLLTPSKLQHDITMTSPNGLSSGSVTVSVMKNEEALWQHTFTTDSTTWKVTGQVQGSISTIKVQSTNATGRIDGRIVGR